jgi:hypothetical protein
MGMPALVFGGHPLCRAGDERLASHGFADVPHVISVSSDLFGAGDPIPRKYTADGPNLSPRLTWHGTPATAQSLALIVEDPDAPTPNPFVHWLAYNIPGWVRGIPEGVPALEQMVQPVELLQGKNSTMKVGYTGCAPPKGDSPHHYHFQLFALDKVLDLSPGSGRSALLKAMKGHLIAKGELVGTYQR